MSLITETGLFKACVEKPKTSLKVSDLYLERVRDPQDTADKSEDQIAAQKAMKLFHMVWSGVTKYMRTICLIKGKSVELADIGVFVPMKVVNGLQQEVKSLTSAALSQFKEDDNEIKLYLYKSFVDQANLKVVANNLLEVFNPEERSDEIPVYLLNATPVNYNSISRVCETDVYSIE